MAAIYIGGQKNKSKGGLKWKLYLFLFLFLAISGWILNLTGPTIVEQWINEKGANNPDYAFTIRDVDLSLVQGQVILRDLKVFNSKTNKEMLEAPSLTIELNWPDLLLSQDKKVSFSAEKVDLILSKDFSLKGELNMLEGKIGELNIIEQKEESSRTVLKLNDMSLKVKELKEFSVTSNIADGGKLILTGKAKEEWTINGSLKQVPVGILNKIAGDKLPFTFVDSTMNAEISAHTAHGKVSGEILPEVKRLNLLVEKDGMPTQTIARALTEELTFTLPFTVKDEFRLQYADTYAKLKNYRKYPVAVEDTVTIKAAAPQTAKTAKVKAKKPFSFWPF